MFSYLICSEGGYKLGKFVIEGKTKQVYEIIGSTDEVLIISKDRITAGDGARAHDLQGKATISNQTNAKVFELLNSVGEYMYIFEVKYVLIHFNSFMLQTQIAFGNIIL